MQSIITCVLALVVSAIVGRLVIPMLRRSMWARASGRWGPHGTIISRERLPWAV